MMNAESAAGMFRIHHSAFRCSRLYFAALPGDLLNNFIHGQIAHQLFPFFGVVAIADRKLVEEPGGVDNPNFPAK
jgi:hypothetical protein